MHQEIPNDIVKSLNTLPFKKLNKTVDILTKINNIGGHSKELSNLLISSINSLNNLLVGINSNLINTGKCFDSWQLTNV